MEHIEIHIEKSPKQKLRDFERKHGKAKWRTAADTAHLRNTTEDIGFIDVTNEPQHIAFLGHELNSK